MDNMEEREKLIKAYEDLDLDNKRNEFNLEMVKCLTLLNNILSSYDEDKYPEPYNYEQGEEKDITEDEFLSKGYINVLDIRHELTLLLKYIMQDKED